MDNPEMFSKDVPRNFFKNIQDVLEEESEPVNINIEELEIFLPLYSKKARKGLDGKYLELLAKAYLKISKNGKRELRYKFDKDSKNDIILKALHKKDVDIGNGFYYVINQMRMHGHDPAFSKPGNMEKLDKIITESVTSKIDKKKSNNALSKFLEKF